MRTVPRTLLGIAVGCALLASPARGQSPDLPWVSLDGSPPGTPVSVVMDPASNGSRSIVHVAIHGFFLQDKQGPAGSAYVRPVVPGMGHIEQTGAPDLPALALDLALPPGVTGVHLTQFSALATVPFPNLDVWPRAIPAMDDSVGVPEQFVLDPVIYGSATPWPPQAAEAAASARTKLGSIQGAEVRIHPFQWSPLGRTLQVASEFTVEFAHEGDPAVAAELITRRRGRMAQDRFANWGVVSGYYPINASRYEGQYLFILPQSWKWAVQPLLNQKAARGFLTQVRFIPTSGSTCESIRTLIRDWYASTPANQDHYCLLVGDESVIPTCAAPIEGGPPTDDLFASVDGDDLDAEVHIGRLAVHSDNGASFQVRKILAYMDEPPHTDAFRNALLVAHKEEAPGKYVGAHESVRTASYASPPDFIWIYGHQAGYTNASITNIINAGVGVVAYRGHGSSNSWSGWNVPDSSYNSSEIMKLANGAVTPVVWSFACNNHDLPFDDSLGEWWMGWGPGAAVSSYGASAPSATEQNHELDRQMFKAVYDVGLTTQSHAIEYAEHRMAALAGADNAWLYGLLGDPEMPIRRGRPARPWVVARPTSLSPCALPGGDCSVSLRVLDAATGQPASGVQVSVWKPAAPSAGAAASRVTGPDLVTSDVSEVFDNRYSDAAGEVVLAAAPQSPGWVQFTVQDESGESLVDSIEVVPTSAVPGGGAAPRLTAVPSVALGWTWLALASPLPADARLTVFDVTGRAVRRLDVPAGGTGVRWALDDESGAPVAPGLYLARTERATGALTARILVLR